MILILLVLCIIILDNLIRLMICLKVQNTLLHKRGFVNNSIVKLLVESVKRKKNFMLAVAAGKEIRDGGGGMLLLFIFNMTS